MPPQLTRCLSTARLSQLRTKVNECEETYNEKKKRIKFEVQLVDEREQLARIDGMDDK